jgi:hypothetical protein
VSTFDAQRPARTLLRMLWPSRWRIGLAVLTYAVKHSPVWLLPLVTANIIDVVVSHRPVALLWVNAAVPAVVLMQNMLVGVMRRRAQIRNEQFRTRVEQMSARVSEMTHLMPITRAHGLEHVALRRVSGTVEEVGRAGFQCEELLRDNGLYARMHSAQLKT